MAENILLYFSDTGRGHRSATEAVEGALQRIAQEHFPGRELNLIKEPVAEKSSGVNRAFVEAYNFFLRKHQHLMKYYYDFVQWVKPNERHFAYLGCREYLTQHLIDTQPSVVVSMHPMTNHFIYKAMKEVGIANDVKLIVVITDPNVNLWRGWACHEADVIIAPNELVKDKLLEWKISESKIRVLGMPVSPDFLNPPSVTRGEFLSHLGLSTDLPTLCINAGWAGGGNMLQAYRSLKDVQEKFQVLFLCGHNKDLYEKAKAEAIDSRIPTAVLPFHDRMPDLMSAVDAMVTKAGGLTTFECIARKLPMIVDVITPPMPQEAGTVDMLVDAGMAQKLQSPEQLPALIKSLRHDPDRMSKPLPEKYCLNRTDAVFEMAKIILQNTSQFDTPKRTHSEVHLKALKPQTSSN